MDYLDPKKKQRHKIQLFIGYGLFAIAIGIATLVLVYLANGYYVDRGTGQIIQNGLVYVDSKPGGASVYLNNVKQRGVTDARLVLPAGDYDISLGKGGYREWRRSLALEGGTLRELTYARLIPNELETERAVNLRANPVTALQSINKRWIALGYADNPLLLDIFDTENPQNQPLALQLPPELVENTAGQLEIIEWAGDNKTFIAKYITDNSTVHLLIDRENPELARNMNTIFNNRSYQISFRDRNKNEYFVYQPATQSLFTASLDSGVSSTPFAVRVQEYKTFENDWLLYITNSTEEGMVEARFRRGDNDVLLKNLKVADNYLLQLAKLENDPIMGIASTVENRATVYRDPLGYLEQNPQASIPLATTVLRVSEPIDLRISSDSSMILAYGLENFASHEFEADRTYIFNVEVPIDPIQELRWVDGQHFLFSSGGIQMMMDFDGSNMYDLVASEVKLGSFYNEEIDNMFTFALATPASENVPTLPASINLTSLLTEEDR
jgi:hypothetical protein